MQRRRAVTISLASLGLGWAGIAPAALPDEQTRAIRRVIESQLAAFAADDAERAFSFATPAIRERFGSAARFLAAVREGYPVVYRPAYVGFLAPDDQDGRVFQRVQMRDAEGAGWIAVYEMQRQDNGEWRINGCVLGRSAVTTT